MKSIFMKTVTILLLLLFLAGCATNTKVNFYTNVDGAEVYVDGELIGVSPVQTKLSNAIWNDPQILIKKDGYMDLRTYVKKELKVGNLLSGIFLSPITCCVPLLWVFGPDSYQNYILTPKN